MPPRATDDGPWLTLPTRLQGYRETGALNALVSLFAFPDDRVFVTKAGDVGVVLRLAGVDEECLDYAEGDDVARRFESALRQPPTPVHAGATPRVEPHVARRWHPLFPPIEARHDTHRQVA